MGQAAAASKEDAEESGGSERKPLWWALAFGVVVLSCAVAYKIVKADGQVDLQGGADGIQVKISQAQKTIASAQQEVADAQKQLDEREAHLKEQERALQDREAKVAELLASIDQTDKTPAKLTTQQVQTELKKLRTAPPLAAGMGAASPVKVRIDKLGELRNDLDKTSAELKAAGAKVPAP
ncbi:MAG TPA: hypothetical protein VHB79_27105 [Polyangiaceae bacterium]|nr:hypothetical protein [Polyangiaceae bacterium]